MSVDVKTWVVGYTVKEVDRRVSEAVARAREEQAHADMEAANEAAKRGESWTPNLNTTPLADELAEAERGEQEAWRQVDAMRERAEKAEAERDEALAEVRRFLFALERAKKEMREACEMALRQHAIDIINDGGDKQMAIHMHRAADKVEDVPLVPAPPGESTNHLKEGT
jgi:hypothetical protein